MELVLEAALDFSALKPGDAIIVLCGMPQCVTTTELEKHELLLSYLLRASRNIQMRDASFCEAVQALDMRLQGRLSSCVRLAADAARLPEQRGRQRSAGGREAPVARTVRRGGPGYPGYLGPLFP